MAKGIDKKKLILGLLGAGAAGTAAYFIYKKVKTDKEAQQAQLPETTDNSVPVVKTGATTAPKKKKSKGLLPKIITPSVPKVYEPIDPEDVAKRIKDAGEDKNLTLVIQLLQKLQGRGDYELVNAQYKKLRLWGNKSIVSDLLTTFFTNEADKKQIRNEFLRIGLVQDAVTGNWSVPSTLTGFRLPKLPKGVTLSDLKARKHPVWIKPPKPSAGIQPLKNVIQTIRTTYVVGRNKKRTLVKAGVILGERIFAANGMTYFKGLDQQVYSAPTKDIIRVR